jgi:hypothetical protein
MHGGDWIIQEKLNNADWLSKLLPSVSPLSTLRIVTSSTVPLDMTQEDLNQTLHRIKNSDKRSHKPSNLNINPEKYYIRPLAAVLRLGRAGAATDHSSVLFNVELGEYCPCKFYDNCRLMMSMI